MRISDWSSDVCSSDLGYRCCNIDQQLRKSSECIGLVKTVKGRSMCRRQQQGDACRSKRQHRKPAYSMGGTISGICGDHEKDQTGCCQNEFRHRRSEEHTSELQSLMRISYAVFCLKNKIKHK